MSQKVEEAYPIIIGHMNSDVFENAPRRVFEDGSIMIYARPRTGKGQMVIIQEPGPARCPDVQQDEE